MLRIEAENNFTGNKEFIHLLDKLTTKSISDIANIVQKDIEVNIAYGRSIYGGVVTPNRQKTRVLFKSGTLFKSVRNVRQSSKERIIFIDGSRSQIAKWLQYGTAKMKARPFFGFAETTLQKIDRYLKSNG